MTKAIFTTKKNDRGEPCGIVFICTGHAGKAERGEDLVCASASILTYTLAQTVHSLYEGRFLKRRPKIKLSDGYAKISVKPKRERFSEVYNAFAVIATGFTLLEASYTGYVSLEATEF